MSHPKPPPTPPTDSPLCDLCDRQTGIAHGPLFTDGWTRRPAVWSTFHETQKREVLLCEPCRASKSGLEPGDARLCLLPTSPAPSGPAWRMLRSEGRARVEAMNLDTGIGGTDARLIYRLTKMVERQGHALDALRAADTVARDPAIVARASELLAKVQSLPSESQLQPIVRALLRTFAAGCDSARAVRPAAPTTAPESHDEGRSEESRWWLDQIGLAYRAVARREASEGESASTLAASGALGRLMLAHATRKEP